MAVTVSIMRSNLLNSVAAAVLAVPLWAGAVLAQEVQSSQGQIQATSQLQQTEQSETSEQVPGGQQGRGDASDALLATVGGAEIRYSDLMEVITELPAPLNEQPRDLLTSFALQQLLLREAILQEARTEGLAQDPEVQSLVTSATQTAEEDALVQVWLERELATLVTSEAVDEIYARLQSATPDELPPFEQLRPSIEENLRRSAVQEIQDSLLLGADVTFYGPYGQPRP